LVLEAGETFGIEDNLFSNETLPYKRSHSSVHCYISIAVQSWLEKTPIETTYANRLFSDSLDFLQNLYRIALTSKPSATATLAFIWCKKG